MALMRASVEGDSRTRSASILIRLDPQHPGGDSRSLCSMVPGKAIHTEGKARISACDLEHGRGDPRTVDGAQLLALIVAMLLVLGVAGEPRQSGPRAASGGRGGPGHAAAPVRHVALAPLVWIMGIRGRSDDGGGVDGRRPCSTNCLPTSISRAPEARSAPQPTHDDVCAVRLRQFRKPRS